MRTFKGEKMKWFNRLIKENRGNVVVEFALTLPLLLLLFSGIYELTVYALLQNKLTRVTSNIGFVVAKDDLSRDTLIALIEKAEVILRPFTFTGKGGIIVSHISVDDDDNMFINWREGIGVGSSRIGGIGDAPANLPNNITVSGGQRMIVAEAFYDFNPIIVGSILEAAELYSVSIHAPRSGEMDVLLE